ncbi:MAG: DNA-processing protein DprA [Candidatus Hydrogenedentota bacterium]
MNEREALILLNLVDGFGPVRISKALESFRDITRIFTAKRDELLNIPGWNNAVVENFKKIDFSLLEKEKENINRYKLKYLTILDKEYPEVLKKIYDPPVILYYKGDIEKLKERCIGIVGSRRCSNYGAHIAFKFASELGTLGFSIVSGFARGIDTMAHRGALKTVGGTIAVLGSGFKKVYPELNRDLIDEVIKNNGLIISEFGIDVHADKSTFPRRNRIISGLAVGVVIVEATIISGSLITARYALEQGREVFAVPGPVNSPLSQGTHQLIKEGATLVEKTDDILETFGLGLRFRQEKIPKVELGEKEANVYKFLSYRPIHIEELIAKTKLRFPEVAGILVNLQIKSLIQQLPGQYYALK